MLQHLVYCLESQELSSTYLSLRKVLSQVFDNLRWIRDCFWRYLGSIRGPNISTSGERRSKCQFFWSLKWICVDMWLSFAHTNYIFELRRLFCFHYRDLVRREWSFEISNCWTPKGTLLIPFSRCLTTTGTLSPCWALNLWLWKRGDYIYRYVTTCIPLQHVQSSQLKNACGPFWWNDVLKETLDSLSVSYPPQGFSSLQEHRSRHTWFGNCLHYSLGLFPLERIL